MKKAEVNDIRIEESGKNELIVIGCGGTVSWNSEDRTAHIEIIAPVGHPQIKEVVEVLDPNRGTDVTITCRSAVSSDRRLRLCGFVCADIHDAGPYGFGIVQPGGPYPSASTSAIQIDGAAEKLEEPVDRKGIKARLRKRFLDIELPQLLEKYPRGDRAEYKQKCIDEYMKFQIDDDIQKEIAEAQAVDIWKEC